ncbi:hypothetical protein [Spirillospora albida]|uniref:hypothetical protein n=1 Tax=Spirillospora albida TaxID=58123 RepID=UPI0004C28F41|nr:hypothetical protein [Spirillospora albida]
MIKRLAAVGAASLAAGTVLFAATPAMADPELNAYQNCSNDGEGLLLGLSLLNNNNCSQEVNQFALESNNFGGFGQGHHGHGHGHHHGWHPGWHRGHTHGHWYKQGQQSEQSGYAVHGSFRAR